MDIAFERRGGTLRVLLSGELDQHCAAGIRKQIDGKLRALQGVDTLVLDLLGVGFMDSSGIGVILGRYKLMREIGGELKIINAQKSVDKLLRLSGVYALLEQRRRALING